jgi:sugar O-acyltransferase (sialic acid O-acetyltransferase NeuD family)
MEDYYIIGAGGHASVINDIFKSNGFNVKGFFADFTGTGRSQFPIIGKISDIAAYQENSNFIIAIGDNTARSVISNKFSNLTYITVLHPSAVTGSDIKLGQGTAVFPNVVINSGTIIGNHVIINSSATIEHDCIIGNFAHVSPRAVLCGGVHVGENTWIGAGATIIQKVKIGKNVIVGAGAVVIRDIPDGAKVVGVPAEQIR